MVDNYENLTQLLCNTLQIDDANFDKSFSESGGNSVLAMKFILRVKKETGLEIPLEWMFSNKTIEKLLEDITKM